MTQAWVACRWVKGEPGNKKEIHRVKWVEPRFVKFGNVVEKIESEALERITRGGCGNGGTEEWVFLSSLWRTFEYMI
jgi:hypothetical protein